MDEGQVLDKEQQLKKELMEFYQEQIRKEDVEINKYKGKLRIHFTKKKRFTSERSKFSGKKPNTTKKVKKDDKQDIPNSQ